MMPSLDHCMNKPAEMTALSNSLEVFDTYKHREDKDSDEESFHLPLDDDESESKYQNGNGNETEEDILNKYDSTTAAQDAIDSQLEERLLNDEEEEKKGNKVADNSGNSELESAPVIPDSDDKLDSCQKDQVMDEEGKSEEEKMDAEDMCNEVKEIEEKSNASVESNQNKTMNENKADVEIEKSEGDQDLLEEADVSVTDGDTTLVNNVEKETPMDSSDLNVQPEVTEKESDCKIDDSESKSNEEVPMETNDLEETSDKDLNTEDVDKSQTREEEQDKSGDKCENSNDSSKHQNDDSEDLFDITVIRDAQEDNAYNDHHSDENNVEESEDYEETNIDKGEDESSDKTNNLEEDEEEIDIDKQEQLKNDDVDIEESNLKLECEGVKDTSSDTESDSTAKTEAAQPNKEEELHNNSLNSVAEIKSECSAPKEVTESESEISETFVKDNSVTTPKTDDVVEVDTENGDSERRKQLKRQLSEGDEEDRAAKKTRKAETEQDIVINEVEKQPEKQPLQTLLTLSDFMKAKKHNRRLTMHDLEEFCLQKICEVLVHKSELGDVQHQLKMQEQLIETMRKEIQQLTKQARDLEIVNKKLMNDLKQQTTTQKPLNPLKITRSVGLQVKFTPLFENNMKRRPQNVVISSQKNNAQGNAATSAARGARNIPNNTVPGPNKQVQGSSPQKQQQAQQQSQATPKPNGPLLSQALQNRRPISNDSANKGTTQTTPRTPNPRSGGPSASVIDLTDEDDKKDKNRNSSAKVTQKNNAVAVRTPARVNNTTGIRLATSQGKVTPISSVVTSTAPQVMYVVQSSSANALTSSLGPKAVVVNFQSANGVLTSALNGSAVSVIPKQSNTVQLKTVQPSKALSSNKPVKLSNKHPAPLPPPPIIRVSLDKPLKPIPPKPHLTIRKTDTGIILQWKMPYELDMYEVIASYQLYAYQETSALPSTDMWRKVGDVKALALPMACTLTQFADKNKYYFAVRPVDIHKRIGVFSEPEEISL